MYRQLRLIVGLIVFGFSSSVFAAPKCEALFVTEAMSQYETREVMDVSRTERALTLSAKPKTSADIINAIKFAQAHGLKVTVLGTNHTHGGHNRRAHDIHGRPRAIQLDMMGFNKILSLDKERLLLTVQSGTTWKEISQFLDGHGLAAMTEQSSNIFSVGGSLSANIHGRDIHGPMINSVDQIKFIDAKGSEKIISRSSDPYAFRALIGGYGGLGVVTEVTLRVEKNYLYEAQATKDVSVEQYSRYLQNLSGRPDHLMHYGRVNISGDSAFQKVSFVEWQPIADSREPKTWAGWKLNLSEKNRWVSSMIMNLMRYRPTSGFGKYIKDVMDKYFGLPKAGIHKTKNNILNNPVQFLFDNFYNQNKSVDILQEYFVPVDKLENFLLGLKKTTADYDLGLMNVTMRYVPRIEKAKDSLLSPYSDKRDQVAVVLYFNIQEKGQQNNGLVINYDGSKWTQEIIDHVQQLGGTFYWPYHRWWRQDQVTKNDQQDIQDFFKVKDRVDPDNVFENDFMFHLRAAHTKN